MACKTGYLGGLKDAEGNYIGFFINGTDEAVGVVSMAALAGDYVADTLSPDGTFRVCIEAAGTLEVQLSDGTDFTVTAAVTGANVGQWLPLNIRQVYKTGSTATFSVGW
jgi:hypothetical protein